MEGRTEDEADERRIMPIITVTTTTTTTTTMMEESDVKSEMPLRLLQPSGVGENESENYQTANEEE